MQRFDRIMGLLLYLRSEQRTSAAALASRFEVSTRTIHRDIELLSALGVPVYAERGRGGGIRLMPGYFLPPVTLTSGEATSVMLGLTLLRSLRARPYDAEIETARRKVLAAVPDHVRELMAEAERTIGFEAAPFDTFHPEPETPAQQSGSARRSASEGQVVTVFLQAVFDRQRVRMRYASPYREGPTDDIVEPGAAFWDRDRWYLAGRPASDADGLRIWRADRVLRIAADSGVAAASTVDVRDLLERAWLRPAMQRWAREAPVRIALSPRQRDRLQQDWFYRYAAFDTLQDGRVRMTYGEDDPERVFELLRWLGPQAELIEPVEWRALLRNELARMVAAHMDEPG